ncbi:carboxylic acid reductase [Pseudonocardia sp. HH130629-09]|uniref:carboxylic acid reductase n=1 Tax=Pseudonocardia sp. HH130629-09 TaxID=1641402 RepID=UPI0006CB70F7|nr:carboxylic acid reductase [Pseudonocardia sp. HH130629-09]ALE84468.1 oxidoreductase [Pseudonocardia sp. HH130629-09]
MNVTDPEARAERLAADLDENDPQYRAARRDETVRAAALEAGPGLAAAVDRIMTGYGDRPALAQRDTEPYTDPATGRTALRLLPSFSTLSYAQAWERARRLATAWAAAGVRPGEFVATIGFTSTEYATVDLAVVALGAVAVPLQPSSALPQLQAIVDETAPVVLATSQEYLGKAVELARAAERTPRLVVFDHHPEIDDERETLAEAAVALPTVQTLDEVLDGAAQLPLAPLHSPDGDDDPLAVLIYTSGSTGAPKGAMYPQRAQWRAWSGHAMSLPATRPTISLNFMPLSHMMGRTVLLSTLGSGGIAYFVARSDLSTLFEDLALARPTEFHVVPRIFDMLFQLFQSELHARSGDGGDPAAAERAVLDDLRERVLGGRILRALVGSAPISPEMKEFAQAVLGVPLHEGYGSTECGVVLIDGVVQSPPVTAWKLVDVPELGYHTDDHPHPRGELLVRTDDIFPGYYHRPEVTSSVFDDDGYYRTGDIMAQVGPDRLVYVDRRNNVQKLSQGEFVALSKVEAALTHDPAIRQVFVHGNSDRPYLLAVVVPSQDLLDRVSDPQELHGELTAAVQLTARRAGLEPYEIPRDLIVEPEPFSMANGLLSDIRKLLRPRLRERYGERLDQLYAELARAENDELAALRASGADQPVQETVIRAARAMLGASSTEVTPDATFLDLGGDSLSALSFSNLLHDVFGVEVPVGVVINPAGDLRSVAAHIERLRDGDAVPTPASVHGPDAVEIRAEHLRLDAFLDPATLAAAPGLPAPAAGETRTVLLTGATGFLGRFMCLDRLEQAARTGGTVVCVVRGSDDAAARRRLDETFDSGDPELLRHYRALAEEHLEVLAGDLGSPRLGLDEATWERLTSEVDVVLHSGALVNHVLPYGQLFGPNVVGTAEVVRLALTTRLKPVVYLSTIGVADQIPAGSFAEETDIREMSAVRHVHDGYANGYAMSKWAGEVLLREAHDLCGLPVTVFRSDMILAHTRWAGQLNVPDVFTRLIVTLLATGLAPASFYEPGPDGGRARAHYDGLPVDFSAAAVDGIGTAGSAGFRTFHLFNPHDDGISLDTFVDWLVESGHTITRLDDYVEWRDRVETALRGRPEQQRKHSLLPVLRSYDKPADAVPGSAAPTAAFRAAVQAARPGGWTDIPHLDRALIEKYAADVRLLGLV